MSRQFQFFTIFKKISFLFLLVLFVGVASAWAPPANIDLQELYNITGAPYINATMLGAIYFDSSEDDMCVCKSGGWKLIKDGNDCT